MKTLPLLAQLTCRPDTRWVLMLILALPAQAEEPSTPDSIQLGPRPFYLIDLLPPGPLKNDLEACAGGPFVRTRFSMGHRGAPLQFPEHTEASYRAAARMGAGVLECDVSLTRDGELVCRHSQCDLHSSTNILQTPLAAKCTAPPDMSAARPFEAVECCTSDLTLAEFKTLCGKMDAEDRSASTLAEYLDATPRFRTDLYASCGQLLSHRESIALIRTLGARFAPELKRNRMIDDDYDPAGYAQQLIDEYKTAGVAARDVFPQSLMWDDIQYWLTHEPEFARQAVFLDRRPVDDPNYRPTKEDFQRLADAGLRIIAPPIQALLTRTASNRIGPSEYAKLAKAAGLELVTWTLERSGRIVEDVKNGDGDPFYYETLLPALENDGDTLVILDMLARDVGVRGVFSDWPATTTYYASCMKLN